MGFFQAAAAKSPLPQTQGPRPGKSETLVELLDIKPAPPFELEAGAPELKKDVEARETEDDEEPSEEEWETQGSLLIADFMNQVGIIDRLNSKRPLGSAGGGGTSGARKEPQEDPFDFEFKTFDSDFYKDFEQVPGQVLYSARPGRALKFLGRDRAGRVRRAKKKSRLKMISLCKSLHFFNIKSIKMKCKYCEERFTPNGLGGHVSRKHQKESINYNYREQTKRNRLLIKERNKKFVRMALKY